MHRWMNKLWGLEQMSLNFIFMHFVHIFKKSINIIFCIAQVMPCTSNVWEIMARRHALFHQFYYTNSFVEFNIMKVASNTFYMARS
jgi:hypothetical protein